MPKQDIDNSNDFISEVRGILISANVIIHCFLCIQNGNGWYIQSVRNLIQKIQELGLKPYLTELDQAIASVYCNKLKMNVREEEYGFIRDFIERVRTCPVTDSVISCATHLESFHSPDVIRLAAAFEHDLAIVTWEPKHFASSPNEVNELDVQQYTKRHIGNLESVDISNLDSENEDGIPKAGVWIFSVNSFSNILDMILDRSVSLETNLQRPLTFKSYDLSSSNEWSVCHISIQVTDEENLIDEEVLGDGTDIGLIDAMLRAVENAVNKYYELPKYELTFSVLDTWEATNKAQVQISCRIDNKFYRNIQTSVNLGIATGHAYTSVLNAIIEDMNLHIKSKDIEDLGEIF